MKIHSAIIATVARAHVLKSPWQHCIFFVCKMESDCSDLESSSDESLEEVVLEEEDHEHILVSRGEVSKNTTG